MESLDGSLHKKFAGIFLKRVCLLREVLPNLDGLTVLHAGPPFVTSDVPAAVRNATVHALLFEGGVTTPDQAVNLIDSGKVNFQPAQDWGVVTPLAQVVSPSMPVFVIGDGASQMCAPIVEGAPIGIRFGSPEPECLESLRCHADFAVRELGPLLQKSPVKVAAVIKTALEEGNDCHSLTDQANSAFLGQLEGLSNEYRTLLENSPGFVLPILMAAAGWLLQFGPRAPDCSGRVVAAGGNGLQFGIRLSGQTEWSTILAQPPEGTLFPNQEGRPVLGSIGDSAVIDFCGLGGQALSQAPSLVSDWEVLLPKDWSTRPGSVLGPSSGVVCAQRVTERQLVPIVNLALVSADARGGILGKGFYQPDLSLFKAAQARGAL
ncbi:DUF1116 domain-containing protein [Marinobacter sp. tcs-11]|uniref:oxamate carbamoyltransferase subunit AllG family protein n=1 Tax=Marinobacter sp. tcs-11 TaxID=1742860 RepID=UPI00258058BF|nr:DUF1116 domain-containing protein [Marinobacter sp. tcs-11]